MIIEFSTRARNDLAEIGDYIALHNPARAQSYVRKIHDSCMAIGYMPRAYPLLPRYEPQGFRRCIHGNYLIIYRVTEELVEIVRIIHGARDYEKMLLGDSFDP